MSLKRWLEPSSTSYQAKKPKPDQDTGCAVPASPRHQQDDDGPRPVGAERQAEQGQRVLFFLPKRKRLRTQEELYKIFPPNDPVWARDSQCFENCWCWVCKIMNGKVIDNDDHAYKNSSDDDVIVVYGDTDPSSSGLNPDSSEATRSD